MITADDHIAFADFWHEVRKAEVLSLAEQQAQLGGPPLTEMGLDAVDAWLREFHAEASCYMREKGDAGA